MTASSGSGLQWAELIGKAASSDGACDYTYVSSLPSRGNAAVNLLAEYRALTSITGRPTCKKLKPNPVRRVMAGLLQ
jgi:hypothetical protein